MAELAADLYVAAFLLPKTGGPPANRGALPHPHHRAPLAGAARRDALRPARRPPQDSPATPAPSTGRWSFPTSWPAAASTWCSATRPGSACSSQEQEYFAPATPRSPTAPKPQPATALSGAGAGRTRLAASSSSTPSRPRSAMPKPSSTFAASASTRRPLPAHRPRQGQHLCAFRRALLPPRRPEGRAGVIVPTGIATDATTAPFLRSLIEQGASPA